ncbi:MAG: right-handed parallel beta-helix repeat-containing protein [Bacteroidetes bacterium]|nr:right-handed parallel beta-helix repeat-containing protein [Bacteroidota bacterium]
MSNIGNMTQYFREMSQNAFKVIGNCRSVITPQTRLWYLQNGKTRSYINKEIIQQLDQSLDFSAYDNWHRNAEYSHSNNADNVVDMIFIIYRNVDQDMLYYPSYPHLTVDALGFHFNGEASLGGGSFTVDNGARTVSGWYPGSGLTIAKGYNGQDVVQGYTIHELGHYLLGGGEYHMCGGSWGMMSNWVSRSRMANSFERYRLGWITIQSYDYAPPSPISLADYLTTGQAIRIALPSTSPQEYFYLENHQRVSAFDKPDANFPGDKGLFVLHMQSSVYNTRSDNDLGQSPRFISADGKWDWAVDHYIQNPWGSGTLPVFRRATSDVIYGYFESDSITYFDPQTGQQKRDFIYFMVDPVTGQDVANAVTGDGRDAFSLNRHLFDCSSNPPCLRSNRFVSSIGFDEVYDAGGIVKVQLHSYSNYWGGVLTQNTTISGNATIACNLVVSPGVTLTIAPGTTLNFLTGSGITVSGALVTNSTLNIPSNVTLEINPGATLRFASGVSLDVTGTLNATGTASQPVSFTSTSGTWGGIKFYHSNGTLNYCNISNATYGVWSWYQPNLTLQNCQITNNTYGVFYEGEAIPSSTVPSPTIRYCTISNNYYGIYYQYSAINSNEIACNTITNNQAHGIVLDTYSSPQNIHHNTISGNGGDGVYNYYSNPGIYYNTISNNWLIGVYGYGGISQGSTYMNVHENTIQSNAEAIRAESGKWIYPSFYNQSSYNWDAFDAANYSGIDATNGFNQSLYDDMYISVWSYSHVWARGNCWMWGEGFNGDGTGSYAVDQNCMISPSVQNGSAAHQIPVSASISASSPSMQSVPVSREDAGVDGSTDKAAGDSLFAAIHERMRNGKYDEAIALSSQQLQSSKSVTVKGHILNYLAECYRRADKKDFTDFLNKQVRRNLSKDDGLYAATLELENGFLLADGKLDQVNSNLITLKSDFSGDSTVHKHALFDLINLSYRLNNSEKAGEYFTELKSKYPNDVLTRHAMLLVGVANDSISENARMNKQPAKTDTLAGNASLANYPNPFNPTTAITYRLPVPGKVGLKVYDILGREVVTLVSEYQEAGVHKAYFNGQNLASGVYFYRLTAPGISQVKKMLMVK